MHTSAMPMFSGCEYFLVAIPNVQKKFTSPHVENLQDLTFIQDVHIHIKFELRWIICYMPCSNWIKLKRFDHHSYQDWNFVLLDILSIQSFLHIK